MSTIASSFEIPYVITGNPVLGPIRDGLSWGAIILPRGPHAFQWELARRLWSLGAREIILAREPPTGALTEAELPLRYLKPSRPITEPLWVQLALSESRCEWMFVIADTMDVLEPFPPPKLIRSEGELKALVYLPELKLPEGKEMPSLVVPLRRGRVLQVTYLFPQEDLHEGLVPVELVGLYRPNLFLQTGGFDPAIPSPYWQKIDWGFRVHLWGESIQHLKGFRIQYLSPPQPEDGSPAPGYERFYLKNVAPRFVLDHLELPYGRFLPFWLRSGLSLRRAWREFRAVRQWIEQYRFRFRMDAVGLFSLWAEWG